MLFASSISCVWSLQRDTFKGYNKLDRFYQKLCLLTTKYTKITCGFNYVFSVLPWLRRWFITSCSEEQIRMASCKSRLVASGNKDCKCCCKLLLLPSPRSPPSVVSWNSSSDNWRVLVCWLARWLRAMFRKTALLSALSRRVPPWEVNFRRITIRHMPTIITTT